MVVGNYEVYRAKANAERAFALAATESAFTIEVRFLGGLTEPQKNAFKTAADRWTKAIVGDLPTANVNGEEIDDVMIEAQGVDIDGKGGILGMAGPRWLRPNSYLPVTGIMSFDKADLGDMEQNNILNDVITHEMGHVLGFGIIWVPGYKNLLKGAGTANPTFNGKAAKEEYKKLLGTGGRPKPVPVENEGGTGTANSHWREKIFRNELMTGWVGPANPMSRLTIASMQDLGYMVDFDASEPYNLPNLMELAEAGLLVARAPTAGIVLPTIPSVLPSEIIR